MWSFREDEEKNKAFFEWVHKNAAELNFPVKCYDFTFALPKARELFRDLEHLNVRGSEVFGRMLNEIVLRKPQQ